jgi:hypothetical protein
MKSTDNYDAKLEIWAKESKVYPLPTVTGIPRFGWKKFKSYEEFNAWKKGLLAQIAASGGVKWMK